MQAIKLRDKGILHSISTSAGVYKWYMPLILIDSLSVLIEGCEYKEDLGYFVYVGIATNMREKLNWHVSQKHSISSIKSGFLSTLRQTLCGLAKVPMDDEDNVNAIINQMSIEVDLCSSKHEAEIMERNIIKNFILPLNIMHNNYPFVRELRQLRSQSRNLALQKSVNDSQIQL
jgi:hypothetical protein